MSDSIWILEAWSDQWIGDGTVACKKQFMCGNGVSAVLSIGENQIGDKKERIECSRCNKVEADEKRLEIGGD